MKVLIAIDSSPCSQCVLDEASARPWPLDTNFFVLNVVDVQRFSTFPVLIADARSEATQLVNSNAEQLLHAGHKALAEARMGFPRKVISKCANELQADLIMVGSHGHSAMGRFLLGSVAQAVFRIAPCSVENRAIPSGRRGTVTPRTQKIIRLLRGYRRRGIWWLRFIERQAGLWNRDRVANGKVLWIDQDFLYQQAQNLLSFTNIQGLRTCL